MPGPGPLPPVMILGILLVGAISGCFGTPTKESPTPTPTPRATYANYNGDWSVLNGSYVALRIFGDIQRSDAHHARVPWSGSPCVVLPIVQYDVPAQTMNVSTNVALSPDDPGPLLAVVVGEWHLDGCQRNINGAHGINGLPRALSLPLPNTALVYEATLRATTADSAGFEVATAHATYGGSSAARYYVNTTQADAQGYTYAMEVHHEPWGSWPLANVHRMGRGAYESTVSQMPSNSTSSSPTAPQ